MNARVALLFAACCLTPLTAHARDWFVRAGADGDGSRASPFADPWQALDKCEAGDVIHVAGGKYFGRLGKGQWEVPFDNVSLLGGYDADFKTRDPWKNLTQLLWEKGSKNRPIQERFLSNKENTTLDGFVFDQREQCEYQDPQSSGRTQTNCDSAIRLSLPGVVRNNVIVNPGFDGIAVPAGSTVENNLVVNAINFGIKLVSLTRDKNLVATVKNNTVLFTMTFKEPGKGAYNGSAIGLTGGFAAITDNILAHSDNNGIYDTANPEKTVVSGNVFSMNMFSNLKYLSGPRDTAIDDKEMDLFDEVGFKKAEGNEVKSPGLTYPGKWLDAVSKRTAAIPGKLVMDDFNKVRQLAGLPMIATGGAGPSGVAPAMDLVDAMKFMTAKSAGKAGARVVPLPVSFQAAESAAPSRAYAKADVSAVLKNPGSFDGKALELVVAISSVANVSSIPAQYKPAEHAGMFLHETTGDYGRLVGFYKKGSSAERAAEAAAGYWQGSGKPMKVYVAKGIAYELKGNPKAGFFVDSLEEQEAGAGATSARPVGRDWFVRAGASGGDGSREKPFKDPFQALEKVEAGDSVHVAEGEYFGKLKGGKWTIETQSVSLLGGYDSSFKERNPWKHPTRLRAAPDLKGSRIGYTLEGVNDHSGAIVDGFVFDKVGDNKYKPNGDLDYDNSDKSEHLWLSKPGCIIRNNVFLNGAEGALRVASGITVENNIFINHHLKTVNAQRGVSDAPLVFRNNTVAFAWDIHFGEGNGRNGSLLNLENGMRAVVDGNLFEFADNDAIRMAAMPSDVELTNNTFNHNLFSNLMLPQSNATFVDDKTFGQLKDLKLKKASGNQVVSAGLPVDQKFFDVYLGRVAYTPGKVTMDDWNQLRELLGQPVIATGGKLPEGFMPAYPWQSAVQLFPKNAKVTSGARAKDLPVSFSGVARKDESYDYADTTWEASAKSAGTWDKLDGKRVALKIVIRTTDNQYTLADAPKDAFSCFSICGPEGIDSGGLPMRVYVKKGTTAERKMNDAKSYSSGTPEQTYVLKGVARSGRMMVVEAVERAD